MDNIKDWFLEDPKRIQAFADAQEAFEQAKAELPNKIFDSLRENLKFINTILELSNQEMDGSGIFLAYVKLIRIYTWC